MTHRQILIVEDDLLVASSLRAAIGAVGPASVAIARDSASALSYVDQHRPDLALVDIELGRDDDGVELAKLLLPRGIRVVFTSGHAEERTLARVRGIRASGFLVKPFSVGQLRATLEVAGAPRTSIPPANEEVRAALEEARSALRMISRALGHPTEADPTHAVRLRSEPRLRSLSERERQVMSGLLAHQRPPAIAAALGISPHTVRAHLKTLFMKFHVSSQQELLDRLVEREPAASTRIDDAKETSRAPGEARDQRSGRRLRAAQPR